MHQFPVRFYCRAKHPILRKRRASSQDLLGYPLGSFKLPTVAMAEVTQTLDYAGDPAKLWTLQCDNLLVTERVTAHSDMIMLGPQEAFASGIRRGAFAEVVLEPPLRLATHFGVVKLRDRTLSPAAEYLIQLSFKEVSAAKRDGKG